MESRLGGATLHPAATHQPLRPISEAARGAVTLICGETLITNIKDGRRGHPQS